MYRRGAPNKKALSLTLNAAASFVKPFLSHATAAIMSLGWFVSKSIHRKIPFFMLLILYIKRIPISTHCMHGLMIASGMPRFCPTPACKIKESLIELKRVTSSKTGELEESYILSDFYLSREFTDGELRLLIDSLLFSQHIPYSRYGNW